MSRSRPAIDIARHLIDPGRTGEETPNLEWSGVFADSRPVEVEIGCGKGLFLSNAASALNGVNFLGIELSRKYAKLSAERLARLGTSNAKVWCGDARAVLARVIPEESLRAVHVYFPDPWWKNRHKKRRVFTSELVQQVARVLSSGGMLNVATDVGEYFDVIRGLIDASERFLAEEVPAPGDLEAGIGYLTHFERKYRIEGRRIYQGRYVRK